MGGVLTHYRSRTTSDAISARAFSLVEIVLVLSILAMVAAIATPRLAGAAARTRARAAAERIASDFQLAIASARAASKSTTVSFDAASDTMTISGVPDLDRPSVVYTVRLGEPPYSVDIEEASFGGLTSVTIDGFGTPGAAGSVSFRVGDERRAVALGLDGAITIRRLTLLGTTVDENNLDVLDI